MRGGKSAQCKRRKGGGGGSKKKRGEGQGDEGDARQRWLSRGVGMGGMEAERVGEKHRKAIKDGLVTSRWQ